MILRITLCNLYKVIFYKGIKVPRTVRGTQKKFLKSGREFGDLKSNAEFQNCISWGLKL